MKEAGISDPFIAIAAQGFRGSKRDKIVALNVLGFNSKADYSGHITERAIRKCSAFERKNRIWLERAEKEYGVSREIIASLLWVETKHGKNTGRYSVPGVYFSLLQADHPKVLQTSLETLSHSIPHGLPMPSELDEKVRRRSRE
jgi:membrane-bound lytic murein transglycosylase B